MIKEIKLFVDAMEIPTIYEYNVWKHVRYPSLISRQPGW